ncbi:MAG TPA: TetR/AcrR family transcriptional regulator [Burkholderiaceae bacterium]|nr:TetR/AcrR family transcriptional regulator [Burkholderiaceae bacterium]
MPPAASIPAERSVTARTRKQLLERTIELIAAQGRVPSVSEVALASGVSRATAYRYFPSRSRLIASVVDYSLGPMRAWNPKSSDGRARVAELFESTFARFIEYEPQMRAALQLALEHAALEAAGVLDEEPYRRGYRIGILRNALAPLQPKLTRRSHELLSKALSLVYGIESYVVLKDIWKADNREVEAVARWMVDALVSHAVATGARSTAVRDGRPAGRSAS